jgi:hypothetical protein
MIISPPPPASFPSPAAVVYGGGEGNGGHGQGEGGTAAAASGGGPGTCARTATFPAGPAPPMSVHFGLPCLQPFSVDTIMAARCSVTRTLIACPSTATVFLIPGELALCVIVILALARLSLLCRVSLAVHHRHPRDHPSPAAVVGA